VDRRHLATPAAALDNCEGAHTLGRALAHERLECDFEAHACSLPHEGRPVKGGSLLVQMGLAEPRS
jgi:hypothetical protein